MPLPVAIVSDTFTGSNGAAWNSTIWNMTGVSSPSTATIQSNAGQMTSGPGTGYDVLANAHTNATVADVEALVTITPGNADEQYGVIAVRCNGSWNGSHPDTGYGIDFNFAAGQYDTFKSVSSTDTVLAITTGFTASTPVRCRIRVVGTTFQTKVWLASGSEPTAWDQTFTDSSVAGAGSVALTANDGAAGTVETVTFDNFVVQVMTPVNVVRLQAVNRASVY